MGKTVKEICLNHIMSAPINESVLIHTNNHKYASLIYDNMLPAYISCTCRSCNTASKRFSDVASNMVLSIWGKLFTCWFLLSNLVQKRENNLRRNINRYTMAHKRTSLDYWIQNWWFWNSNSCLQNKGCWHILRRVRASSNHTCACASIVN